MLSPAVLASLTRSHGFLERAETLLERVGFEGADGGVRDVRECPSARNGALKSERVECRDLE